MSPEVAVISSGDADRSRASRSAYGYAHPRAEAVDLLHDGVSLNREESRCVKVGKCGTCSPRIAARTRSRCLSHDKSGVWSTTLRGAGR